MFVFECFVEGDFLAGILIGLHPSFCSVGRIILVDIGQLEGIHFFTLFRFVVNKYPEAHPYEAKGTDHDEGHFPAPCFCNERNGEGGQQSTYLCTRVEDTGGISPVFLGEVLGGGLDGGGEVACLADGQYQSRKHEEGDTHGNHQRYVSYCADSLTCTVEAHGPLACSNTGSQEAAESVHHRTERPYTDGPEKTLLGIHPVDKFTGEEHRYGIKNGEEPRDGTVVTVGPVELRCDKVGPSQ
ncbi:hypothetical protein SDC9_140151 [bioreactor metagenome]|uniref:Uncharacterized protein n=1 Tax=bioreactor metagenome TaxID=1076179 RepID=A0A645DUQ7_9ZZZZ